MLTQNERCLCRAKTLALGAMIAVGGKPSWVASVEGPLDDREREKLAGLSQKLIEAVERTLLHLRADGGQLLEKRQNAIATQARRRGGRLLASGGSRADSRGVRATKRV
jgi:hypothetical protein